MNIDDSFQLSIESATIAKSLMLINLEKNDTISNAGLNNIGNI